MTFKIDDDVLRKVETLAAQGLSEEQIGSVIGCSRETIRRRKNDNAAFEAAIRIRDLAKEVHIDFKKVVVIGNRFPDGMEDDLRKRLQEVDLNLIGMIPNDDELSKANYLGNPLTDLPSDNASVKAVEEIAEKLGLLSEATMLKLLGKNP